jgi:Tol biopolymer transport system component
VAVLSLTDRQIKKVLPRMGMFPRYARGMLTYVTKGRLVAVPFDLEALEVRGPAKPLLEEVSNDTVYGFAQVDFSAGGMLLYRRGRTEGLRTLEWMDASGKTVTVTSEPAYYLFPRVSPDGARLIWTANEGANADVWIHDVQRGGRARLTSGTGVNSYPVWSPDGQVVVFSAGGGGIYWTRADGAGRPLPLTETTTRMQLPSSFTPDGKRLVYSEHEEGRARIQTLPLQYEAGQLRPGRPELFLQISGTAPFPAFSPDGRWLAYADSESGRYEVYVRAFPDRGTKWQISNSGGTMPLWSRNGRELFYRTEDSQVMVVDYSIRGDALVAQKPRVWSERRLANTGLSLNLDLAPGGDRLLALMPAGSSEPRGPQRHVTLVLNPLETPSVRR